MEIRSWIVMRIRPLPRRNKWTPSDCNCWSHYIYSANHNNFHITGCWSSYDRLCSGHQHGPESCERHICFLFTYLKAHKSYRQDGWDFVVILGGALYAYWWPGVIGIGRCALAHGWNYTSAGEYGALDQTWEQYYMFISDVKVQLWRLWILLAVIWEGWEPGPSWIMPRGHNKRGYAMSCSSATILTIFMKHGVLISSN